MAGKVYLTGAGPGDIELITLKAKRVLKEADVILYDRLANEKLLQFAGNDTEFYYVGKKANNHYYTQGEINDLLVKKAKEGKTICRLKGGDPFIFGRGGEEALLLKKEGIDFEIIPGISSSNAVPAYAGIPLTQRHISSSFAVITGHEAANKKESDIDLEKISQSVDTLVILMGVKKLAVIVERLLSAGINSATPIALIRWGSRSSQEVVKGKIYNIVQKVKKENVGPPAVIIIGDVVKQREKLKWFENKSLFSKKILVTRPENQASSFSNLLQQKGAEVILAPMIEIKKPDDFAEIDESIENLDRYDWIIFTSTNGVEFFMDRLHKNKLDSRALSKKVIGAIGSKTAEKLANYGILVDFIPENYSTKGILSEIQDYASSNNFKINNSVFLLPRADIAPPALEEGLKDMGAKVNNVTVYKNVKPNLEEKIFAKLFSDKLDMLTFTSSSTVNNFFEGLKKWKGDKDIETIKTKISQEIDVACIGPVTADTARKNGIKVEVVAEEYTIKGLFSAIVDYYNKN